MLKKQIETIMKICFLPLAYLLECKSEYFHIRDAIMIIACSVEWKKQETLLLFIAE